MKNPPISITDFAEMKGCSRQTIYNNMDKFNLTQKGKIIWDAKSKKWEPDKSKQNIGEVR